MPFGGLLHILRFLDISDAVGLQRDKIPDADEPDEGVEEPDWEHSPALLNKNDGVSLDLPAA